MTKWYSIAPEDNERVKIEADVHRLVSLRGKSHTNFVEFQSYKVRPSLIK